MNGRRSRRNDNNYYENLERQRLYRTDRNVEMYFHNNFVQQPRRRFNESRLIYSIPNPRPRNIPLMQTRRIPYIQTRRIPFMQTRRIPLRDSRRDRREINFETRRVDNRPRRTFRRSDTLYNQPIASHQRNDRRINRRRSAALALKIFVSNLSPETVNDDLITIFGVYGRLKKCEVILKNSVSTCTGIVQYFQQPCANRAFNDLNKTLHKGNIITLEFNRKGHKKHHQNNQGSNNGPQQNQA